MLGVVDQQVLVINDSLDQKIAFWIVERYGELLTDRFRKVGAFCFEVFFVERDDAADSFLRFVLRSSGRNKVQSFEEDVQVFVLGALQLTQVYHCCDQKVDLSRKVCHKHLPLTELTIASTNWLLWVPHKMIPPFFGM